MKDIQKELQLTGANFKGSRRELDFYPTPPEVTYALMDFLQLKPSVIWECACGNYSMSNAIAEYGHKVISTDINQGVDFLDPEVVHPSSAIITNPPFNLSEQFIRKAIKHADVVAMLLKSQYWHAAKRYDLFNETKPAYVLPLTWRPDFLFQERKEGKKGSPTMEVAWTVWIKGENKCKYIPLKRK